MFGFVMVEPVEVTGDVLASTNVVDAAAAWVAGSYSTDDERTHAGRLWKSLANTNTAEPGTDDTKWVDLGADNPHAMFDDSIQTQSTAPDLISAEVAVPASKRADVVFLQNLDGYSATVVQTDDVDGVVSSETQSLNDNSGISNIYAYYTAPIRRKTAALFELKAAYAGSTVTVQIHKPGSIAKCGDCVVGQGARLGTTQFGGEVSSLDFSTKERNAFGSFTIVERGFADTGSYSVWVAKSDFELVRRLLIEARAQRRVWIPYAELNGMIVNGFVRDWRIRADSPTRYLLGIEMESLA